MAIELKEYVGFEAALQEVLSPEELEAVLAQEKDDDQEKPKA